MTVRMYCDGPACEAVVDVTTKGWLTVSQRDERNIPADPRHFCSWLCLSEDAIAEAQRLTEH